MQYTAEKAVDNIGGAEFRKHDSRDQSFRKCVQGFVRLGIAQSRNKIEIGLSVGVIDVAGNKFVKKCILDLCFFRKVGQIVQVNQIFDKIYRKAEKQYLGRLVERFDVEQITVDQAGISRRIQIIFSLDPLCQGTFQNNQKLIVVV